MAQIGAPAPPFALSDLTGPASQLSDHRGEVILLNFWATWCVPCRSEMPALQQLRMRLGAAAGAEVLTINFEEDAADVSAYRDELGLSLPMLLDADGDVARSYGARGLPATFLVDPEGVLVASRLGPLVQSDDPSQPWSEGWLEHEMTSVLAVQ